MWVCTAEGHEGTRVASPLEARRYLRANKIKGHFRNHFKFVEEEKVEEEPEVVIQDPPESLDQNAPDPVE